MSITHLLPIIALFFTVNSGAAQGNAGAPPSDSLPHFEVRIEPVIETIMNHIHDVRVIATAHGEPIIGYDFSLAINPNDLIFKEIRQGIPPENWEMISPLQTSYYFDTCRSICPIQIIRARADFDRDLNEIDIGRNFTEEFELCVLRVQSVAEMRLEDSETPVRFFWDSCGTNFLTAGKDKERYVADLVFDRTGAIELNTGAPWLRLDENPNPCKTLSPDDADRSRVTFRNGVITFVGHGGGGMVVPCDKGDLDGDGSYVTDKDQKIIEDMLLGIGVDFSKLDTNCVNKAKDIDQDGIPFTLRDLVFGSIYGLPNPQIIPVREPTDTVFVYFSEKNATLEIVNMNRFTAGMVLYFRSNGNIDSLCVNSDYGKVSARSHFPAHHDELRILLRTDPAVFPSRLKKATPQQTIDLKIFSASDQDFLDVQAYDFACSQLIPVVKKK